MSSRLCVLTASIVLVLCAPCHAAEGGADDESTRVLARFTIRSLASMEKALQKWGIPLPDYLKATGIGRATGVLADAAVDPDRPIGASLFLDTAASPRMQLCYAIPIHDHEAAMAAALESGLVRSDTDGEVLLAEGGSRFRFADGYMAWSPREGDPPRRAIEQMRRSSQWHPGLAGAELDTSPIRELGEGDMKSGIALLLPGEDEEISKQRIALQMLTTIVTDSCRAYIEMSDAGVQVMLTAPDCDELPVAKYFRPGLPQDCSFRVDTVYRGNWIVRFLREAMAIAAEDSPDMKYLLPAAKKSFVNLMYAMVDLLLECEAITFSLVRRDDDWVLLFVKQCAEGIDIRHQMERLASASVEAAEATHLGEPMEIKSYELADGTEVLRLQSTVVDEDEVIVDAVQRDGTAYVAVCEMPGKYVAELLACPVLGEMEEELSIDTALDPLTAVIAEDPATSLHAVASAFRSTGYKPFGGASVALAADVEGGELRAKLTVPKRLVAGVTQIGLALGMVTNYDEDAASLELVLKRLSRYPSFLPLYSAKASALCRVGRYEEAVFCIDSALALGAARPELYESRAWANYLSGRDFEALADWQRYLEEDECPDEYVEVVTLIRIWYLTWRVGDLQEYDEALRRVAARAEQTRERSWPWPILQFVAGSIDRARLRELSAEADETDKALADSRFTIAMHHLVNGRRWNALIELDESIPEAKQSDISVLASEHELQPLNRKFQEWRGLQSDLAKTMGKREFEAAKQQLRPCMVAAEYLGEDCPAVGTTLFNWGQILYGCGEFAAAEDKYKRGSEIWRQWHGEDHRMVTNIDNATGVVILAQHRPEEARALFAKTVASIERTRGESHEDLMHPLHNLSITYGELDDKQKAYETLARALAITEAACGADSREMLSDLQKLAALADEIGLADDSARHAARAAELKERLGDEPAAKPAAKPPVNAEHQEQEE